MWWLNWITVDFHDETDWLMINLNKQTVNFKSCAAIATGYQSVDGEESPIIGLAVDTLWPRVSWPRVSWSRVSWPVGWLNPSAHTVAPATWTDQIALWSIRNEPFPSFSYFILLSLCSILVVLVVSWKYHGSFSSLSVVSW